MTSIDTAIVTMVADDRAVKTWNRAFSILDSASNEEEMTEHPAPSIKPNPENIIHRGTVMFTAARPSLPTPCPTKTPLMAVTAAILNIPKRVGKNNFENSDKTLSFPKSIAAVLLSIQ